MGKKYIITQAFQEAVKEEMRRDESVFYMGQDVSIGLYGASMGLSQEFGKERVRDTAIAEACYTGMGVGAAMVGMRPIVDWALSDFSYCAFDQVVNSAAKNHFLFGGQFKVPVVFVSLNNCGRGLCSGAQHSNRPHPMFMNVPGLKIIGPTTPVDMYGLMKAAIRDDDPVIVYRDSSLDSLKMELPDDPDFIIPIGKADIKREGKDITIVGVLSGVNTALEAAAALEKEGISAEVIDLRTIKPIDTETIFASVRKTGHLICVDTANRVCSAASEIAALTVSECFDSLKAPVGILAVPDTHFGFSPVLDRVMLPTSDQVADKARELLK